MCHGQALACVDEATRRVLIPASSSRGGNSAAATLRQQQQQLHVRNRLAHCDALLRASQDRLVQHAHRRDAFHALQMRAAGSDATTMRDDDAVRRELALDCGALRYTAVRMLEEVARECAELVGNASLMMGDGDSSISVIECALRDVRVAASVGGSQLGMLGLIGSQIAKSRAKL
jgi:hypothetical protein